MANEQWDVIVVGAGSAGLPAAIKAAERGAKVLQIDADERIGGTLYWSSGQIAAAGTSIQKSLGIDDTPEDHYNDVQRITEDTMDPVLGRLACDNGADTIEWLLGLGFKLGEGAPSAGVTHEPYEIRRYYWGPNLAISILDVLKPVHDKLVAEGKIDLRLQTRLERLTTAENGDVTGIEVKNGAGTEQLRAKNVVLASGGYAANPELWSKEVPGIVLRSYCNPYSRGDGLQAAAALGATVNGAEKFLNTFAGWLEEPDNPLTAVFFTLAPNQRRVWEIYVDVNGKRFCREDHPSIDYLENSLLRQPEQKMWIVCDEGIFQNAPPITLLPEADYRAKFGSHPNFLRAETLPELAEKMNVPADNLEAAVAGFNAAVASGDDPEFGRQFLLRSIGKGPYYAMGAAGVTVVSPSGLQADDQLRVLRGDGTPIPNLYAAGEVLGFTRLSGKAFAGGMSLTPAMTFGRLLGEKLLAW